MKKLIFMLTAVIFIFTACQKEEGSADPVTATSESGFHKSDCQIVTKMIAGGGKYDENCTGLEVGTITVNEVGDNIGIKASGGIGDLNTLRIMVEAGATRIGSSNSISIIKEYEGEKQ